MSDFKTAPLVVEVAMQDVEDECVVSVFASEEEANEWRHGMVKEGYQSFTRVTPTMSVASDHDGVIKGQKMVIDMMDQAIEKIITLKTEVNELDRARRVQFWKELGRSAVISVAIAAAFYGLAYQLNLLK